MAEVFQFPSAVRGFHYYRRYWQPSLEDELFATHEEGNSYDFFAIKICLKNTGITVGHLPMEISRSTKFLLDKGAAIYIELASTNYCVSPLVQGGLEIPCRVKVLMAPTVRTRRLIDIYKDLVELHYDAREKDNVAGSYLCSEEVDVTPATGSMTQSRSISHKGKKQGTKKKNSDTSAADIRSFFKATVRSTKHVASADTACIVIDED